MGAEIQRKKMQKQKQTKTAQIRDQGGHSDPERGGGALKASVRSKSKGAGGHPWPPPLDPPLS